MRFLLMTFLIVLAGCERNTTMSRLSDFELGQRYGFCLDREPTAPGKAQACENLRRECERRKRDLGTYVCRHN